MCYRAGTLRVNVPKFQKQFAAFIVRAMQEEHGVLWQRAAIFLITALKLAIPSSCDILKLGRPLRPVRALTLYITQ